MSTNNETIFNYLRLSPCGDMVVIWDDTIIKVTRIVYDGSYFNVIRNKEKPVIFDIIFGIDEIDADEPYYLKIIDKNGNNSIIKFEL